jgi:hypothetical protein
LPVDNSKFGARSQYFSLNNSVVLLISMASDLLIEIRLAHYIEGE